MKYETPELTALTPAITAVQSGGGSKPSTQNADGSPTSKESATAYADWE